MGALAGLGALAGGFGDGLERGQRMQARQQGIDAEGRRQKDQEALQRDTKAADAAMVERLKGFELEHQQAQPSAPGNYMTLGGTDSSMPDQTAVDQAPAAASPFRPSQQQLMHAAQARTNKLFELGRHDVAVRQWAQDEGLRAQMRKQAVEKGMLAFKAGGDIKPLLTGVYETLDDGYDLGNVEQVNNPDPKAPPVWNVERVNSRTGEKSVTKIGADQVDGLVQFAMDPMQSARYSLEEKLAKYKNDQQRQTNAEQGKMTLEQIRLRNEGSGNVADTRAESAERVANIRAQGTITGAQIRAASSGRRGVAGSGVAGVQSVQKNVDGTRTLVFRDGTNKLLVDDKGAPIIGVDAEKMLQSLSDQISKSLDGLTATPEANRERASGMLPKPAAPRRSLADFDASKPKPPLSSFQN